MIKWLVVKIVVIKLLVIYKVWKQNIFFATNTSIHKFKNFTMDFWKLSYNVIITIIELKITTLLLVEWLGITKDFDIVKKIRLFNNVVLFKNVVAYKYL